MSNRDRTTPVVLGYARPQPRRSVEELLTDFVLQEQPTAGRGRLFGLIMLIAAAIVGTLMFLID